MFELIKKWYEEYFQKYLSVKDPRVVIEVDHGVVTQVTSNIPDLSVIVMSSDFDNYPHIQDRYVHHATGTLVVFDGKVPYKYVTEFSVHDPVFMYSSYPPSASYCANIQDTRTW